MKNREWLNNMCTYDFLMTFVVKNLHVCPRSFLGDEKKSTEHCLKTKCSVCLNDYLNEEHKTNHNM